MRVNKERLESEVDRAKSSIKSSDVDFLRSRPEVVSTFETNHESYSLVLKPEAQFLPEFTKDEKVRVSVLAKVQGQTTQFSIPSRFPLGSRG